MLTIESFRKLEHMNGRDWYMFELYESESAYIMQIQRKVGYWNVKGMKIGQLTINLDRTASPFGEYKVSTAFVIVPLYFQSVVRIEDMGTLEDFVHNVINKHIYKMIS
jgi:hypothetical protein